MRAIMPEDEATAIFITHEEDLDDLEIRFIDETFEGCSI